MASRRGDPGWRDRAASDLLVRFLGGLDLPGPALVMEDPLPEVETALKGMGLAVSGFDRRAYDGRDAAPWPTGGPFGLVALRLPRGKEDLSMSLAAAASVLRPEGVVLLYGAKDEGIQAAEGVMGELFARVETVAIGGRCRVLRGSEVDHPVRGSLGDWKTDLALHHTELPPTWVSYPGVFAHGRLDDGSRLLLDALPHFPPGSRVLDYGCGSGAVGYVLQRRMEGVELVLLDVDTVALEAAGENVPGAHFLLLDGLPSPEFGPFHGIVSNPPFHRGKAEDPRLIVSLIEGAPALLRPEGMLVFVSLRRLSLKSVLAEHFRGVEILAEDSTFRVWKGKKPRKKRGR